MAACGTALSVPILGNRGRRQGFRSKRWCVPLTELNRSSYLQLKKQPPNGWRYPLVGGTRQRRFAGTRFKPRKLSENAPTPTSRVHLRRMRTSYFTKETGSQEEYTVKWQTKKPYVSIGEP